MNILEILISIIFQMNKKKSEAKINLPSVGVKLNQTMKNYASKPNTSKFRDVEDKNIYFQMPSIHQNDLSLKAFMECEERPLGKMQAKISKYLLFAKEPKMKEQWDLYMKKSEILNNRSLQFSELEEYLMKTLLKIISKLTQMQQSNSFTLSKSIRASCSLDCDSGEPQCGSGFHKNCTEGKIFNDHSHMKSNYKHSQFTKIIEDSIRVGETADPINSMMHQNVLLEKKSELFEKRILELEKTILRFQEKQNEKLGQKDTTTQLMIAITTKNKYKYESDVKSIQIESISRQFKNSQQQVIFLKEKVDIYQKQFTVLKEQNDKFREYLKYKQLWLMATEQALSWRRSFHFEREQHEKCKNKIKLLKDKNKQLLNYFNMSNAVNPDQEEDKQDLDRIIKEFKQWLMIISVPKVTNNSFAHTEQTQQLTGTEQISVKLLRPNFYVFFQAFQNTLLMEKNIINIRPIQMHFFLRIRLIFDSMFKQFIIARSFKEYPSFPQFVIGFLQKYHIHPQTGKLQHRRKSIQNEQKITFLVNLFNKSFCNTWECEIFKNFLYQNYHLDEIFFFLDCRNQFNNGSLSCNTLGSVDAISYVKLSKALKVAAKHLAPYENYIIEKVKNILRSKKKIKYGEAFIDKHFVLKLLLQVYSLERTKSERIFESSFNLKMKKTFITFGDFHNFMGKNFSYLTSIQIAELYREVYSLSSGHITHKTIHYMCGYKGLFIPLMLQKRVHRSGLQKSLSGDMLLLDMQNTVSKMMNPIEDCGEESFIGFQDSLNQFMRQLDFYKGNKALFYHRVLQQKSNVLRVNTLLQLSGSYELNLGQIVEQSQIQTQLIQLHSLLHQSQTQVKLLTRNKDKRTKAWRMLVRNFKIRIQESILQFQKINQEEIKKLKGQIQNTNTNKAQQLEQYLKKQKASQSKIAL